MKITIRPLFGKVKNFADEYTKAFASIFGGFISIIISSIMEFHSLWQLDIICVEPVWQTPRFIEHLSTPIFADSSFADGPFFRMSIGQAYDFFLGLNVIGWGLAIAGTFLVMLGVVLFYRANYLEWKEYGERHS